MFTGRIAAMILTGLLLAACGASVDDYAEEVKANRGARLAEIHEEVISDTWGTRSVMECINDTMIDWHGGDRLKELGLDGTESGEEFQAALTADEMTGANKAAFDACYDSADAMRHLWKHNIESRIWLTPAEIDCLVDATSGEFIVENITAQTLWLPEEVISNISQWIGSAEFDCGLSIDDIERHAAWNQ